MAAFREVPRETQKPQPSWLDRFIGWMSPAWGARRDAWHAFRASGGYRSARPGRLDSEGSYSQGSADYHLEIARDRREMVDRARFLDRDNALAHGLLDRSVENVVGTGHHPQAATEDSEFNKRAEDRFRVWADREADVRGLSSFEELQALAFRSVLRDGDVGAIKLDTLQLQMIESDQISAPYGTEYHPRMIDGVEVDHRGKPIRYHVVHEPELDRLYASRRDLPGRRAIPEESFLFYASRTRLGQTRGEPVYGTQARTFDHIDQQIEAVTYAARMAACFGLVLTTSNGYEALPKTEKDKAGRSRKTWQLEPGLVKRLEADEKLTQLQPGQPTQNLVEFIRLLGRFAGLPLGLPLELVFLDFSQTNYSSARAALLQAYRVFRLHQQRLTARFLCPVWRWLVLSWIAKGELPVPRDDRGPEGWAAHTWISPGWAWIDPTKEIQAQLLAVDGGMATLSEVVRGQGKDFEELLKLRRKELDLMEEYEIEPVRSTLSREPKPPAEQGAPQLPPPPPGEDDGGEDDEGGEES